MVDITNVELMCNSRHSEHDDVVIWFLVSRLIGPVISVMARERDEQPAKTLINYQALESSTLY